ncbi:uncharacterized protein LOC129918012 [Episyrphus balteatus]|uniref:uncharacterized protein LOC129918012 n=1 Tax=Episyrphus balteatus TaxID=286459 RepID=UPI0024856631|nr:uncharacterized protein LOC129918012 [Episyrphus balteatus]
MSSEEEFHRWLNRSEKTFEENFHFAIKSWKSSEFPLSSKYEKILEWFSSKTKLLGKTTEDFNENLFNEFLSLKCPLGSIDLTIKRNFIEKILKWTNNWKSHNNRKPIEILFQITELEMMQDLFRTEYEIYARVLGKIFKMYENYLREFDTLLVGRESELFNKIIETVKSRATKTGNLKEFEEKFTEFAFQPLIELIIVFQDKGIKFFDDLLDLQKTLFHDYVKSKFIDKVSKLSTHVNLLAFECAIVNYRGDIKFYSELIKAIFLKVHSEDMSKNQGLILTIIAYTLEMFRKHDISLNFEVSPQTTAIQLLLKEIQSLTIECQEEHLLEVLNLLCATLRLNPLILEKSVFEITARMMVAKKNDQEQKVFEEYLILLMDMFRKLSRAEKFVGSLQKSVRELLATHQVPKKAKKRRTITESGEEVSSKKIKLENGEMKVSTLNEETNFYLEILFNDFHQHPESKSKTEKVSSFPYIDYAWPTSSVGLGFSKLIIGLMSKPSLVIWKTLIYALKELISNTTTLDDNTLFLFDFYSSLLCQYFSGCKLPEQSDKFWAEIESNRQLTRGTLKEFGHFLLAQEHNNRTMNAFLECSYHAGLFDLLLWYYRPDFMTNDENFSESSKTLHGYLSDDEWMLIKQRIINFGRIECKFNANRLLLQQLKGRILFQKKKSVHLQKTMLAPASSDFEQTKLAFSGVNDSSWLLSNMNSKEKHEICELLVQELDLEMIECFTEDIEALEMILLELYRKVGTLFQESKKAILSKIDFDGDVEVIAKTVVEKKEDYSVKKVEVDSLRDVLDIIGKLPIGCCRKAKKELFFVLQLAVFRDLKASEEDELAKMAFESLTDLLHFGDQIQIFKYFPVDRLALIQPPSQAIEFYEYIFSTLRFDVDLAEEFFKAIHQILEYNQSELTDDHIKLLLMSIETLTQKNTHKKLKKFLDGILGIYASHVMEYFKEETERKAKKDKKFVEKTLSGFVVYAKSILAKTKVDEEMDENFRRVCKIYIGYSMDCHNPHAIKLIMVALTNHAILHFDQDEIEFVLNSYWKQLNEDLKASKLDEKTAESVIKIVISNKTNEDLLFMLKKIGKNIPKEDFGYICRLLGLIAKCPFSTIKGAIFNEHFKLITFNMVLRLEKDDQCQIVDYETVLSMLECQKAFAENSQIPLSYDTLDDILAFMMDINVKKFPVGDTNVKLFNSVHQAMTELCTILIKHRHLILMDRVPQFVHIFKDLLQAICWYKSDRQKDTALATEEVDGLAELALKMESLMHLIATHSLEVKRVAPYVLTFTINLMVSNKRPTTLYPKIKTHIENICYDLVAVCDHRVGRFILRCSNEAARQVYEVLVKDHKKYHKFKGKV